MICPHCYTTVKINWDYIGPITHTSNIAVAHNIKFENCPSCDKLVIYLVERRFIGTKEIGRVLEEENEILIYPSRSKFQNLDDIPKDYLGDYHEAMNVLSVSPKASAALSRRLLQNILREEYKIKEKTLVQEIQKFIELDGIPSHLTDAVDAIRNIGNLAAHPTKNRSTGEIVPVEKGEAEWLVEVIEALFDFTFIQPRKLQRRRKELNEKLGQVDKPEMKKKK